MRKARLEIEEKRMTSDSVAESPRPSFWFPTLAASILGVMVAGILYGNRVAFLSIVILLPLLFLVSAVYAMVVMPRGLGIQLSREEMTPRKVLRSQIRGALLGILYATALVLVSVVVFAVIAPRSRSTATDQGEDMVTVVIGGLVAGVLAFIVARVSQLRGIRRWELFMRGV